MILPLTADIRYLHQLAWRPAQFAHPLWLAAVGVRTDNYRYGHHRELDLVLDSALNRLRNFPQQALPAVLDKRQQCQIVGAERLSARCVALGLVYLQCDDYLRLRCYRQGLSPLLSEDDIQQLMGMGYRGQFSAKLSPQSLPDVALRLGHSLAHQVRSNCMIWRALSISLPPQPRALSLSSALSISVDSWLTRLEHLL
ncbi:type III secretion system domain-containing protein [Yersinia alsatica]|uniref:type III secretion system domain-containing protein n=1 Tax=Yersinia alsatica TaxID=2890317 RepID=UPI0011A0505E|nr:type III secretion system domain-containing protein [Yersinia alsatica]